MNKLSKMEFASQDKAVDLDALCQEIRERACAGEFDNQAYVSQDIIEKPLYTTNFTEPLSYQGSAFLKLPKFP
ncbi:hypothetical protein BS437_17055 [Acinetobacter baumannii]|nr:hypothetical protein BS437_17055 [Acinetobacter baumannii]